MKNYNATLGEGPLTRQVKYMQNAQIMGVNFL